MTTPEVDTTEEAKKFVRTLASELILKYWANFSQEKDNEKIAQICVDMAAIVWNKTKDLKKINP